MKLRTLLVAAAATSTLLSVPGCGSDPTQMTDAEAKVFDGNAESQRPADMGEKMAKAKADYEARNPRPPGYGVRTDGTSGPPPGVTGAPGQ